MGASLSEAGEKGVFAREIETTLLSGDIDIAVHSMKDLPAALPDGLAIGAVPVREDNRDTVIGVPLADLPSGAKVGTSSSRRAALIAQMRPDLRIMPIRGNVDTRISKLRNGEYDSIILAAAGLSRLGRLDEIAEYLDPHFFTPDPGQGALAIEIRAKDADTMNIIRDLSDRDSETTALCERACLAALGAGCSAPVGVWASLEESILRVRAMMYSSARKEILRIEEIDCRENHEHLGVFAANQLRRLENSTST
jgi:hydroxymethylbilane synthase